MSKEKKYKFRYETHLFLTQEEAEKKVEAFLEILRRPENIPPKGSKYEGCIDAKYHLYLVENEWHLIADSMKSFYTNDEHIKEFTV